MNCILFFNLNNNRPNVYKLKLTDWLRSMKPFLSSMMKIPNMDQYWLIGKNRIMIIGLGKKKYSHFERHVHFYAD